MRRLLAVAGLMALAMITATGCSKDSNPFPIGQITAPPPVVKPDSVEVDSCWTDSTAAFRTNQVTLAAEYPLAELVEGWTVACSAENKYRVPFVFTYDASGENMEIYWQQLVYPFNKIYWLTPDGSQTIHQPASTGDYTIVMTSVNVPLDTYKLVAHYLGASAAPRNAAHPFAAYNVLCHPKIAVAQATQFCTTCKLVKRPK